MQLPSSIRKDVLGLLNQHVIPALWSGRMPLACVAPPFDFVSAFPTSQVTSKVPRPDPDSREFPQLAYWKGANVHSTHLPYLGILAQGAAEERTLVTAKDANDRLAKGVHAIEWSGPSVILFPPGAPHAIFHYAAHETADNPVQWSILWISLWSEMLLHTQIKEPGQPPRVSHNLQISDPRTLSLGQVFVEELVGLKSENQETASATLLAMLLRVRDVLATTPVGIANTSRPSLPEAGPGQPVTGSLAACREAAIFIQMRLHESLTLERIATTVGFSPAHLNRIFRQHYGVSVIRYVRQQRVAAAKMILERGSENIAEVASLVGFKRSSLFCEVFHRETGLTPGEFRRQNRASK